MEDWIKSYRKFQKWEWYKTPHMFHLFHHLIYKAARKDTRYRGLIIKRGQLVTGRNKIAEETGISAQAVRTCFLRLRSTKEITIESTKAYSIITICNYDLYQPELESINQDINQDFSRRSTNDQPSINHIQEYREDKEKEILKEKEDFQEEVLVDPGKENEIDKFNSSLLSGEFDE